MKNVCRKIFLLFLIILLCATVASAKLLVPGGQVIGLQLADESVTVVDFAPHLGDGAVAAGLQKGDKILQVDKEKITCVKDLRNALSRSDGKVKLKISRSGKEKTLSLHPKITADGPKLGVFLKEGLTGLGTVTFYDPQTGNFGALGHGVNDPNGKLLTMKAGQVYEAAVAAVKKGAVGAPGQLLGHLHEKQLGDLAKNTNQGVFGKLDGKGDALPTGQAKVGAATIRATVEKEDLQEYSVEILKIYPNTAGRTRNMLLKVTDDRLLSCTGGIVQGMSGSPIIQDGKLVGAVTHVLVNDPTTGYGIFIENMLDAAA